jgi:serine protease Do
MTVAGPLGGTATYRIMEGELPGDYWLGVFATRPSPALQAQLTLPKDQGLLVEALQPESPAVKAGLRQYDILLKGNDKPLTGVHDLMQLIGQVKDGKLTLELLRAGKHETVTVTPAKRPARGPEGMGGLPFVFDFVHPGQILPPGGTLIGIPGQPPISPDIEKRFGELQKQLDELRRSVDVLQGKAKENSAAKPE